jgi:hypothetical protein
LRKAKENPALFAGAVSSPFKSWKPHPRFLRGFFSLKLLVATKENHALFAGFFQ